MDTTQQTPACQCARCPGASCTCGCQQPVTPPAGQPACACGPQCQCGPACTCATA